MMEFAIETQTLTKRYRDVLAVDSVDLRVQPGEIYGFLGLNGAGKTTTIRAILGMIRPSTGTVRVLGEAIGPNGQGPWARVGHLVESPSAYPELTVRENLEIARRLQAIADQGATTQIIERLGLTPYADRKAGALSLGNLQRLGLARALLHQPELLILDEPANGLDPAGVVEIRELLERLAREKGVTIFMSSHILTEVDRLATRIGIIHKGCLIEEMDQNRMEQMRARRLHVQTRNLSLAQTCLSDAGYNFDLIDSTILLDDPRAIDNPDRVAQFLVDAGTPPTHLALKQEDLEAYFLRLTSSRASQRLAERA